MTLFRPALRALTLLALGSALTACAVFESPVKRQPVDRIHVTGRLDYRVPGPVPADSVAVVELSTAGDGRVMADSRLRFDGNEEPEHFEVTVPYSRLKVGVDYYLRAAIVRRGQTLWISEPVELRLDELAQDAGTLWLQPAPVVIPAASLLCGERTAALATVEDQGRSRVRLSVGDWQVLLRPAASLVGHRLVGDPLTEVWLRDGKARLTVQGENWPECRVDESPATEAASAAP